MKSVVILYPAVKNVPNGGLKMIYEYSNRLVRDGFDVSIIYGSYTPGIDNGIISLSKCILKYLYQIIHRKRNGCKWFNLDKRIKERFVWMFSLSNIPKADIIIATAVTTAKIACDYSISRKSKGFYFIQDFEKFIVNDVEYINASYRLPLEKITVSNWLTDFVENVANCKCHTVLNGFDNNKFFVTKPVMEKNKYHISMLYHTRKEKDIPTAINALYKVKAKEPQLEVFMFGVYSSDDDYPEWIHYIKNPTDEQHLLLNNDCAIYVGCSKNEGYGLTIGEAMMCGQAVVCTSNKGYLEMAKDNENALVANVSDVDGIAERIMNLINDDELRIRIANNGIESMREFDIEKTYCKFKNLLTNEY